MVDLVFFIFVSFFHSKIHRHHLQEMPSLDAAAPIKARWIGTRGRSRLLPREVGVCPRATLRSLVRYIIIRNPVSMNGSLRFTHCVLQSTPKRRTWYLVPGKFRPPTVECTCINFSHCVGIVRVERLNSTQTQPPTSPVMQIRDPRFHARDAQRRSSSILQ